MKSVDQRRELNKTFGSSNKNKILPVLQVVLSSMISPDRRCSVGEWEAPGAKEPADFAKPAPTWSSRVLKLSSVLLIAYKVVCDKKYQAKL